MAESTGYHFDGTYGDSTTKSGGGKVGTGQPKPNVQTINDIGKEDINKEYNTDVKKREVETYSEK